jgi:aryl-alcohol dehydrogenase-like predicted oxidoreductase
MSLRRLGQESIDLFQLHRIDPAVAPEDQFGLLAELLDEGKVQAVGLSEVSVEQIVRRTQGRHDLDGAEPLQRHQPPE